MATIGIFDSGVGGLTVQRALLDAFPSVDTLYLGDTARVPYGTKSAETVTAYSLRNARVLLDQGIDLDAYTVRARGWRNGVTAPIYDSCDTTTNTTARFLHDGTDTGSAAWTVLVLYTSCP